MHSSAPRRLRSSFLGILLASQAGLLPAQSPPPEPPNVVVVLVDDLGWADLSCQGSTFYRTPHIDGLAAQGMRFTDAYAACAVCSPTRAAVMTGRYPARTGVTDWIRARFQRAGGETPAANPTDYVGGPRRRLLCPPNPFWLELQEVTLAEVLGSAGYAATGHIGKWHLGDAAWYPEHQGFTENFGGCDYGQPPSYFDPYRNQRLPQGIPTLAPRREGEYLTDREGDEAAAFVRRHRDEPFLLYYAPYAVHTPLMGKADLVERYRAVPASGQKNAVYAAMVQSVDDAVGKLLAALDETGVAERTLVVFSSDNGGLLGSTNNAPLRSGKGFPYEGGIRVPLIVRWPGVVAPGSVSSLPVCSIDLLPTIAEAVGAPLPADRVLDGVSLVAHLRSGGERAVERPALFWHFPHYRGELGPYGVVRAGRWKLIEYYEGPRFELYDLQDDLGEERDLAAAQPERVRELAAALAAHLDGVGAKLPRDNPDYRPPARVLLLGDSISMGYAPRVRELLRGEAEVVRPGKENCEGTTKGVARLESWLGQGGGQWDVIHFNFGLHDLKRVDPATGKNSNDPADPRQAEPEVYERQLRAIVERLERTGAKLVFATTTPVPAGVKPWRDAEDVRRYNAIAVGIMRERGVEVDDLYGFVEPRLAELQRQANVHFTAAGSRALGEEVARCLRGVLAGARKRR